MDVAVVDPVEAEGEAADVIVATLEPLGTGAVGFAVSESVLAATTRRIVPPVY